MIYSLNGTIIHTEPNAVVIECGGVGYKCLTTMNTLRVLPKTGEKAMVYTHMIVREDAVELCGFAEMSELNCFRLLTSISGVGAKVAVAILSELTPEQVALAVSSGDSKALTKASGVGNKIAQRIILELKDKVKNLVPSGTVNVPVSLGAAAADGGNISKALGALAVLGYAPDEVTPFMSGIDPELPVERIIGETLKAIGRK
ncbi:MAG: Holliday junction branch migration protein RuvA [Clostridia bacterium]|nr:Holliday junction branch migration protein RuvA [Clostridia bacterium]